LEGISYAGYFIEREISIFSGVTGNIPALYTMNCQDIERRPQPGRSYHNNLVISLFCVYCCILKTRYLPPGGRPATARLQQPVTGTGTPDIVCGGVLIPQFFPGGCPVYPKKPETDAAIFSSAGILVVPRYTTAAKSVKSSGRSKPII
jgi:hypothetical protein